MLSSLFCGKKNAIVIIVQQNYITLRMIIFIDYTDDSTPDKIMNVSSTKIIRKEKIKSREESKI